MTLLKDVLSVLVNGCNTQRMPRACATKLHHTNGYVYAGGRSSQSSAHLSSLGGSDVASRLENRGCLRA